MLAVPGALAGAIVSVFVGGALIAPIIGALAGAALGAWMEAGCWGGWSGIRGECNGHAARPVRAGFAAIVR